MARERADGQFAPVRRVLRMTSVCCMAAAAVLIGVEWAGVVEGAAAGPLLPAALVLGVWSALLSVGLLIGRLRG